MGTKERQQRDRDRIRQAILTAARELFVTEGYRNVSMRKIAERIEYSPAAIYSYFPSKDDIFFALAEEGFRLLAERLQDAVDERRRSAGAAAPRALGVLRVLEDEPGVLRADVHRPIGAEPHARTSSDSSSSRRRRRARRPTSSACIDAGSFPRRSNPAAALHVLWVGMLGARDDRSRSAPRAGRGSRRAGARPARIDARRLHHERSGRRSWRPNVRFTRRGVVSAKSAHSHA